MELLKGKLSLPSHVGGGSNVLSIYYFYIIIISRHWQRIVNILVKLLQENTWQFNRTGQFII